MAAQQQQWRRHLVGRDADRRVLPQAPSLAAVGGVLWLAYENDGDIWYRTSANQGTTWSTEEASRAFVGPDGGVTLAALASGKPGLVWSSIRSGNLDIWFGSPGERDINPPPYVEWIEHRPACNLDSDNADHLPRPRAGRDGRGQRETGMDAGWRRASRPADVRRRRARRR